MPQTKVRHTNPNIYNNYIHNDVHDFHFRIEKKEKNEMKKKLFLSTAQRGIAFYVCLVWDDVCDFRIQNMSKKTFSMHVQIYIYIRLFVKFIKPFLSSILSLKFFLFSFCVCRTKTVQFSMLLVYLNRIFYSIFHFNSLHSVQYMRRCSMSWSLFFPFR